MLLQRYQQAAVTNDCWIPLSITGLQLLQGLALESTGCNGGPPMLLLLLYCLLAELLELLKLLLLLKDGTEVVELLR